MDLSLIVVVIALVALLTLLIALLFMRRKERPRAHEQECDTDSQLAIEQPPEIADIEHSIVEFPVLRGKATWCNFVVVSWKQETQWHRCLLVDGTERSHLELVQRFVGNLSLGCMCHRLKTMFVEGGGQLVICACSTAPPAVIAQEGSSEYKAADPAFTQRRLRRAMDKSPLYRDGDLQIRLSPERIMPKRLGPKELDRVDKATQGMCT